MSVFISRITTLMNDLFSQSVFGWKGLIERGGIISVLLMAFAVVGLAIVIEKFFALRRSLNFNDEYQDVLLALKRNNDDQIDYELHQYPPAQTRMVETAHEFRGLAKDDLRRELSAVASSYVRSLTSRLELLGSLGRLSPLLGLLGTVIGMMRTLSEVSLGSSASPAVLGKGLTEALLTTAVGLIVGIPMIFFHNLFRTRVNSYADDFENFGQALVRAITYPASVEFGHDTADEAVTDDEPELQAPDRSEENAQTGRSRETGGRDNE